MGPQEARPAQNKPPKQAKRTKKLFWFIALPVAVLLLAGAVLVFLVLNSKPTAKDYEDLAAARSQLTTAYEEAKTKLSNSSEQLGNIASSSDVETEQFKTDIKSVTDAITSLGKNRAMQQDPVLREKYSVLKKASDRYRSEVLQLIGDIEAVQAATKGLSTDFEGTDAAKNLRAIAKALDGVTCKNTIIRDSVKDIVTIYKKLATNYDDYYTAYPNGDGYSPEIVETSLSLLEPVVDMAEKLDTWYKDIDIQDEIDSLNDAIDQQSLKYRVATVSSQPTQLSKKKTTQYCLENEQLCLTIPETWTATASSEEDAWTGTMADSVVFTDEHGVAILQIYQWGGSTGGKCDLEISPTLVKYREAEASVFTDYEGKDPGLAKLAYSSDNGATWQWAVSSKGYLFTPEFEYGSENNSSLQPIYDTELTLSECASSFTRYNAGIYIPSRHVKGNDTTATLVVVSGHHANDSKLPTYDSADKALNNPSIQLVTDVLKSARYKTD